MKERIKKYAEIIQIICGVLIVFISCADLLGKPARLVNIIGLVAGSFAAGVGIGVLAARRRSIQKG
jgi:hypothetical protein